MLSLQWTFLIRDSMLDFSQEQLLHSYPFSPADLSGASGQAAQLCRGRANPAPSDHKPTGKLGVKAYLESMIELYSTSKIITHQPSFYKSGIL